MTMASVKIRRAMECSEEKTAPSSLHHCILRWWFGVDRGTPYLFQLKGQAFNRGMQNSVDNICQGLQLHCTCQMTQNKIHRDRK